MVECTKPTDSVQKCAIETRLRHVKFIDRALRIEELASPGEPDAGTTVVDVSDPSDQPALPLAAPVPPGAPVDAEIVYLSQPLERDRVLPGFTYKLKWPESDHAIYITINDVLQDDRRRPFEIFINSKNMEHYAWTVALTRMISAVFRRGGDVSFVVEELKAVFDPRGGAWQGGRYVPSLLAAIGEVIERHMIAIGFLPAPGGTAEEGAVESQVVNLSPDESEQRPRARQCPKCGGASLVHQEGCDLCTACGYSRCA